MENYRLKRLKVVCVLVFMLVVSSDIYAFDIRKPSYKEIFLGYGGDEELVAGDYSYFLAGLDFSYPLKKEGWTRNFSFQLEPFLAFLTSPDTSVEVGCSAFLKYTIPLNFPLKPYIRGGTGVVYLSQETAEQGSQFNFVDQICYGVAYEKGDIRISFEFRNRHISNLDIQEPNSGINSKVWMLGFTSFF